MKVKKTFVIFFLALILLNISIVFATKINNNNISNFFRIHVVANSDSIDDQLLKYQVAKNLEQYICTLTKNSNSKEESKKIIELNIQNILNLCNNIITEQGYDYNVKAYIGKLQYDQKQKDEIHMNSGIYDSLKIVIGNGNGQNWWSLIYPSLPYESIDKTSSNLDKEFSNKSSLDVVEINTLECSQVEYELFIVDFFKQLINKFNI